MKKLVMFILLALIFIKLALTLVDGDLNVKGMDVGQRISDYYVQKSVNGDRGEVVWGQSSDLEDGSANIVTSIVVDYRSFDTLGEVSVLFIAALGVGFVLGGHGTSMKFSRKPNFMLRVGSRMIFGFVVLLGVSMMVHGHLTPGGGFPGGSLIAAAFLLLYLSDDGLQAKLNTFKLVEGTMGAVYVLIGFLGLILGGSFLLNFLDTGVVGKLFSAGILPIVYVVIGLKVGSELIGVLHHFGEEEVAK